MSTIEERLEELEQRVDHVVARDAIRELVAEYCRQVVRGDTEGVLALFTDDASLVTHFPEGSGQENIETRGAEALRKAYSDVGPMGPKPCIHNHIIELDGAQAQGFCSVEIRLVQDGVAYTGSGHYEDDYRRVGGDWRFLRREIFIYHWVPHTEGWA